MVLRVCYQVLGDSHDAQDAFQATFLVLARKARSVRKYDSVASWLYGVADRVARRAKAEAARRRVHERRRSELTALESVGEQTRSETWLELHEEVALLPEKLRVPIVLCYLEGLTAEAAAQQLGCPRGTVLSRLSRARERLRERLSRRGISLSTGLPLYASKSAVPDGLSHATVQAAIRTTLGETAAGTVPASVVALTEGVLRMMSRVRLIRVAGAILAIGAMSIGVGVVVSQTVGSPPQAAQASRAGATKLLVSSKDDPSRKGKEQGGEIIVRAADLSRRGEDDGLTGMVAIDPKTAEWRTIYKGLSLGPGPVSPDGRYIVYSSLGVDSDDDQVGIWVYDMKGETAPRRIFERRGEPFWTNNGKQVVVGTPVGQKWEKFETWRVNTDGTGRVRLPIPDSDLVLDCSRDGTWLATRTIGGEASNKGRLTLVHPDGTGARYLTEGSAKDDLFSIFKISPDSGHVAYAEIKTVDDRRARLFVVDIEGSNRREIPVTFDPGTTVGVCWSPDGSRLALNQMDGRTKVGSIALVDFDGSNFRKLPLPPGRWNVHVCDWNTLTSGLKVGAPDENPDLKTPRGRYQALLQEIKKASQAFLEEYRKAKSDEERSKISREKSFQPRRYIGRFLEIADSAPNDPAAIDALIWIITFGFDGPEFSRAIDRLAQNHIERLKVARAAFTLGNSVSPSAEKLLRAVLEKSPDRPFKGLVCLALGRYLKHQSERVRSIRENPESVKQWETMFLEEGADKEYFSRFINMDPDALLKEAEVVFERTIKEFGGKTAPRGDSLSKDARAALYEIRNLCVGKPAPEIVGQDIDGKPFKLSDYRGKVVVVDFWTISCASCRDMNAYERSLVRRMQGKPFALLGVNGDEDKDKLKEWIKKEDITWRSWRDGEGDAHTKGPIASQFNTSARPTIYILDQRGVIRHKFLGFPGTAKLDAAINPLVEAVENDGVVSRIHRP